MKPAGHAFRIAMWFRALLVLLGLLALILTLMPPPGAAAPGGSRAQTSDVTVLFPQAVKTLRATSRPRYNKAMVLEALGNTRGNKATRSASGIVRWRFVLDNQESHSRFKSATIFYGPSPTKFWNARGYTRRLLGDRRIPRAPQMTLGQAVKLLQKAGYGGAFLNVTLRNPVVQNGKGPLYIFGLANSKYVAVDITTKKVAPFSPTPPAPTPPAPTPPAAGPPMVSLYAHLDPSFTQSPTNPLAVTYFYSASASETTGGVTVAEPNLPSGVLELFSDGLLACAINVGGSTTSGLCPVTYKALWAHTVVVTYISGTISATDTDIEQIRPFSTATTLTLSAPQCYSTVDPYRGPETGCRYTATITVVDQNGNRPPQGSIAFWFWVNPPWQHGEATSTPISSSSVAFTLFRWHATDGWVCNATFTPGSSIQLVNSPSVEVCGTTASMAVEYRDGSGLWTGSQSATLPVAFIG